MPSFALYLTVFLLLLLLTVIGFFLYFSTFAYLKDKHRAQWTELGQPSLMHNTIVSNFKCWKYVLSQKYRSSGDPVLIRRCDLLLVYTLAVVAVFVIVNVFLKPAQFTF